MQVLETRKELSKISSFFYCKNSEIRRKRMGMEDNRKYTFSEIEREFYYENYHEFVEGQNQRNKQDIWTDIRPLTGY